MNFRNVIVAAAFAVVFLAGCPESSTSERSSTGSPSGSVDDTQRSDRTLVGASGTTGTMPSTGTGAIATDGGAGVGSAMDGMTAGDRDGGMMGAETRSPMRDGGTAMESDAMRVRDAGMR